MEPTRNNQFSFPPQPKGSNTCGAYAMAYWWSRHQESPKTELEIETKAVEYYAAVRFVEQNFIAGLDYDKTRLQSYTGVQNLVLRCLESVIPCCVGREGKGYCNPQEMMRQIMKTNGCEFYLGGTPLIWAIYVKLKTIESAIVPCIRGAAYNAAEQRDMLEVVSVKTGVGLHYLYVFSEDGERKAIDPAVGLRLGQKAEKRDTVITRYQETQAAIVIS